MSKSARSGSALPPEEELGSLRQFCVEHALSHRGRGQGRPLLGFFLPPFQRGVVWSTKQQIRFVQSVILGMPIGSYTYVEGYDSQLFMDGWLIDGQQRLTSLARFVDGDFAVFGIRWPELSAADKRRIKNQTFSAFVLCDPTEEQAVRLHKLLVYGGVPHQQKDKARVNRYLRKSAQQS